MSEQLGFVITDIAGQTLTQEDIEILKHPNVGGIILFARNYDNPQQITELTQQIKKHRPNCFIGVDQEGGRVQRFQNGLSKLPNMSQLGCLLDDQRLNAQSVLDVVKRVGKLMALELRSLGIDMSFAPVLDLATDLNPVVKERAIHAESAIVSIVASHYVDGMAMAGMPACGKHFPGHGHVSADSHLSLPVDNRNIKEMADDLQPFAHLIKHGIQSIMPGHILFPKVDNKPASLSRLWLHKILREQLNFQGTIISDDLSMEATKDIGDMKTCATLALDAGSDYILICNDREQAANVIHDLSPRDDESTLKRRRLTFPSKEIAPWDLLQKQSDWTEARKGLDQLNQWGA